MKASNCYVAKRALIDRIRILAAVVGHPLEGVDVADSYTGGTSGRCIYGGGARFVPGEGDAENVVRREVVTTGLYVRVLGHGLPVRDTEILAETLGDAVADDLEGNPQLAGGLTFAGMGAGSADFYVNDDGVEAILALTVVIDSWLL